MSTRQKDKKNNQGTAYHPVFFYEVPAEDWARFLEEATKRMRATSDPAEARVMLAEIVVAADRLARKLPVKPFIGPTAVHVIPLVGRDHSPVRAYLFQEEGRKTALLAAPGEMGWLWKYMI